MRSCSRGPTGLSTTAVTMAVLRPKHRFSPRATLYSPPPSETSKCRVVQILRSPGSKRSITSPRLTRSHSQCSADLMVRGAADLFFVVVIRYTHQTLKLLLGSTQLVAAREQCHAKLLTQSNKQNRR